jgi:hypothetical protein
MDKLPTELQQPNDAPSGTIGSRPKSTPGSTGAPRLSESMGNDHGYGTFEHVRPAISDAYRRTSQAVGTGYNRTIEYGRRHPERLGLMTFAAGMGIGMLLVSMFPRRTRTERLTSPLIGAAADMARAFARRH